MKNVWEYIKIIGLFLLFPLLKFLDFDGASILGLIIFIIGTVSIIDYHFIQPYFLKKYRKVNTCINIKTKPKLYKKFPEINELLKEGFTISIEAQEPYDTDDPEDQRWWCNLYLGDSNSPWKVGTLNGTGRGDTLEQAYYNAVIDMDEVIDD